MRLDLAQDSVRPSMPLLQALSVKKPNRPIVNVRGGNLAQTNLSSLDAFPSVT